MIALANVIAGLMWPPKTNRHDLNIELAQQPLNKTREMIVLLF